MRSQILTEASTCPVSLRIWSRVPRSTGDAGFIELDLAGSLVGLSPLEP